LSSIHSHDAGVLDTISCDNSESTNKMKKTNTHWILFENVEIKTLQVIYYDVISIYKPSDRDHYAVFDFLILKICIKYLKISAIWLLHYHMSYLV
jgi:hypothetical protein